MRTAVTAVTAAIAVSSAACRLDPLVDDIPGASAHLLPAGALVPSASDDARLSAQIALGDGLDDDTLTANGDVITRGQGASDGEPVRFWSFGAATPAPSPLYVFVERSGDVVTPIPHPGLVDAVPGDPGYSPLHTIFHVAVTPAYRGQLITTSDALADAIELGLVEAPEATGTTVTSPIVLREIELEVGGGSAPSTALDVFAHGHVVGMFQLGGALGIQPVRGLQPASHVSFLRKAGAMSYDASRPIFQATIPTPERPAYTALSVVVEVDLVPDVAVETIESDSDLFVRADDGSITETREVVAEFRITTMTLLLPLQFVEGQP